MTWEKIEKIRRCRDNYIFYCKIIYLKNELSAKDKRILTKAALYFRTIIFITDGKSYSIVDSDEHGAYSAKRIIENEHIQAIQRLLGDKNLEPDGVVDIEDDDQLHVARCIASDYCFSISQFYDYYEFDDSDYCKSRFGDDDSLFPFRMKLIDSVNIDLDNVFENNEIKLAISTFNNKFYVCKECGSEPVLCRDADKICWIECSSSSEIVHEYNFHILVDEHGSELNDCTCCDFMPLSRVMKIFGQQIQKKVFRVKSLKDVFKLWNILNSEEERKKYKNKPLQYYPMAEPYYEKDIPF